MIPYPSDRMIINAEYDRGYANGQRDILETLKRDVNNLKADRDSVYTSALDEVTKLIDKYRGR